MLKLTLVIGLFFSSASVAFSGEEAEIKGATKVAVLSRLAEKCDIQIAPSMAKWINTMLADFGSAHQQEFESIADMLQKERVQQDGHVGSCYKLRVELYRDGWLQ
ncbi:hypothetical protein [Brucella intermedia]|uniref:hypothetical protein n=1 Tax=Brucella intermedia TaxID=94625 RepID=UPI002362B797|nr:hypothetical protein [Brucella intermedia]